MVGGSIFKEETTMEKVLARYILDELYRRAYKIVDFDVYKPDTGRYEYHSFVFGIDEKTFIDVTVSERHSNSAGDRQTELHYSYRLEHDCDDFPTILALRKGDMLKVMDDPRDNESPLKVQLHRWGEHTDVVDYEVDCNTVKKFIDEILKRLRAEDFIE